MRTLFEFLFKNIYSVVTSKEYRQFAILAIRLPLRKRHTSCKAKIFDYELKVPDALSFLWQYYEIFCLHSYAFETERKAPIILDCGANVGASLLYYDLNFPGAHVIAYEASPTVFEYLKSNVTNLKNINVDLNQNAVWSENKTLVFQDLGADSGMIGTEGVKVQGVRLQSELARLETVDFLKMDIEGAEVVVLKSCEDELKKVKNIFVEYHSYSGQKQELEEVLNVLNKAGFRYTIQVPNPKAFPIQHMRKKQKEAMDLQVNIWGTRI
jgi:FkbM family methyltransferase